MNSHEHRHEDGVDRLRSLEEAQTLLGDVSHSTLVRLIRDGSISVVRIGRLRRIKTSEIERFIGQLEHDL